MTKINTDLLEKSSIKIRLDITNQHIAYTLQMRLVEAFQHFLEQLVIMASQFKQPFFGAYNVHGLIGHFYPR